MNILTARCMSQCMIRKRVLCEGERDMIVTEKKPVPNEFAAPTIIPADKDNNVPIKEGE